MPSVARPDRAHDQHEGRRPREAAGSSPRPARDAEQLVARLRRRLRGEVRFDAGSRALYATDASNYRQLPIGVVVPRDRSDVIETVAAARAHGVPLLSRGGGTSLAGQCCNTAVVMDFSKYVRHVVRIEETARLGTAQPGCVLDDLREAAGQYGLTFGPDPATHRHCTIGGMLGNNSCGVHSLLSAQHGLGLRTSDNTHELEILTYAGDRFRVGPTPPDELDRIIGAGGAQGRIYAAMKGLRDRYGDAIRRGFPKLPRRVSGYNLDDLLPENGFHVARALVGSEGTLVTVLEATLHLVPAPHDRSLLVLGYADAFEAGDHVPALLEQQPIGLEGLDRLLLDYVRQKGNLAEALDLLPEGGAYLLVEFGGRTRDEASEQVRACMARLRRDAHPPSMKAFEDPADAAKLWEVRESGLGATAFVPNLPDMWPGWEDSAVPPDRVGAYLRALRALFSKYDYHPSLYGHFGQGCIHCRVDFDLYTVEGIRRWRAFLDEAADLVVRHGGSLSGEHGDGQARADLLPRMFDDEIMAAFREFKRIWDPENRMNPGKVVEPNPVTMNLRLGPTYHSPATQTHFRYPADDGRLSRAVLRCVGVGKCRDLGDQVMCPSYMATREEMHSTRGRAHLLWEMLNGDALHDGWRNETVREALDLCLACKGCKHDCPVSVDMATYKAEFLSHYYAGRLRPRQAYSMGWIHRWARLAAVAPQLVNRAGRTPGLRRVAKWVAGVAPARELPAFARQTFRDWFMQRSSHHPTGTGTPVLLWPDTFTNYFHPRIAQAAVEVLEAAGCAVQIPARVLCCGRPLYDFGMLATAKARLRDILDELRPVIQAGIPVVGLEPSCVSVFRDELGNLFPNDADADRLRQQTFLFGEFLQRRIDGFRLPELRRHVLLHGHCHQKSLIGMDHELAILRALGATVEAPEPGCCGMAGAFGFERGEHYQVSVACAERALLPAVRRAPGDTLIVADGFSCREQIRQLTHRRPLHLAEVVRLAMRQHEPPRAARPTATWAGDHRRTARTRDRFVWPALTSGMLLLSLLLRRRLRTARIGIRRDRGAWRRGASWVEG